MALGVGVQKALLTSFTATFAENRGSERRKPDQTLSLFFAAKTEVFPFNPAALLKGD